MAYVAISDKLIDSVRLIVNTKKTAEIYLLPSPPTSFTVSGTDPAFLEKTWGEHIKLQELLPDAWVGKVEDGYLRCKYERRENGEVNHWGTVSVNISFNPPLRVPPKHETYRVNFQADQDHPFLAPVIEKEIQTRLINAKWDKVYGDLSSFLRNCKSLNEALKLWPDCRLYIPAEYLERVEKKAEKGPAAASRAADILKNIDTDQAVASLVELRILQSSGVAT